MAQLHPWQEKLLKDIETGGFKPGEMMVMSSGRRAGKSTWTAQAIDRLTRDLMSRPVEDLVLSEGRVYGARYYNVEPIGGNWRDMEEWCVNTYGPTAHDGVWTPNMRWYANDRKFWFRTEKDRDWFILRWRS